MTEYVESLRYEADIDDVRRKLAQLERHTRDVADTTHSSTSAASGSWSLLGDRVGGVVSGIGSAAMSLAKMGGTALAGLGAAAIGIGINVAGAGEQAQIGFETMLGSADKAHKFLTDLRDFSAKTPFEFPELQTAASSLISVGINANDVIPIMTTLGNVTSGMGTGAEGVQRATVALQQMTAAGRITGEDLNQLRDAGIPVFDLLAAATGKTKEEVVALAQAGKLGKTELDQLFEALKTGNGLERFNGLMEKQSQSLFGLFSSLKDTVSMSLGGIMQPLATEAAKVLPPVTEKFAKIGEAATAVVPKLLAAGKAGSALEPWNQQMGGLELRVYNLTSAFARLVDGQGVESFARQLSLVVAPGGELFPIVNQLVAAGKDLWTVLQDGVIPVVVDLYTAMPSFLTPLGLASDVLGFVADNAEQLQPVLAGLLVGFVAFRVVSGIIHAVTAAQAALNMVMSMNPIGLMVIAIAALAAVLVYAWNNSETFRNVVTGAMGAVSGAIGAVVDAGKTGLGWLGDFIAGVGAGIRWWFLNMTPVGLIIQHWDSIVGFVTGLPGRIRSAASGMWDGIKEAFRAAVNFIVRAWNGLEFKIPGFKIGPVGYEGFTLGVPDIPMLARGGVATAPTLVGVGDNSSGKEAIVPLERAHEFGFGRGGDTYLYVNVAGTVVAEYDLVDGIAEGLAEKKRREGSLRFEEVAA